MRRVSGRRTPGAELAPDTEGESGSDEPEGEDGESEPLEVGTPVWLEPMLQLAVVAVLVVPVSGVSEGGLVQACCVPLPIPDEATVAVLVVPVS